MRTMFTRRCVALVAALAMAGCGGGSDGDDGPPGPQGPPGGGGDEIVVGPYDPLPGVNIEVVELEGGTGPGGNFRPGDVISVRFTVKTDDGQDLDVATMDSGSIYVSGPTFNYQRVIASQSDLRAASVDQGDGTWTYTFALPIPAVYLAPVNDTTAFGPQDGELTGQALLDGTYSLGIQLYKYYDVEGTEFRDAGSLVHDFLVGAATTIVSRAVVGDANCTVCHTEVRAHGNGRVGVRLCLLCHTAGAEDRNVAAVANGTPGVSVDMRVMIHKIHAAYNLPSVVGAFTKADGTRGYDAPTRPLQYVGFNNSLIDLSHVVFPVWPSLSIPTLRDTGYDALPTNIVVPGEANRSAKTMEDRIRRGPVDCQKCHGDPDGAGPATAPAQGGLAETNPTRNACGSCHDDLDYALPYTANGATMPANLGNDSCTACHPAAGGGFSVRESHVHPLLDASINPGLEIAVTGFADLGGNANGKVDPGERIQVSLSVKDLQGNPVVLTSLPPRVAGGDRASVSAVIAGPTSNYTTIVNPTVPLGLFNTATPTFNVPQVLTLEWIGTATDAADSLNAPRAPIFTVTGATTTVQERTATGGGSTTTTAPAVALQNWLDVASNASFASNDYVVVEDGVLGLEEYARIATVQGTRLYFNVPMRFAHAAGATLKEITLTTRTLNTHYTLDAVGGKVNEVGTNAFVTGNKVLLTYVTDFVMPSVYPPPLNDGADLGQEVGEWRGLPILPGTYTLDIWGSIYRDLDVPGSSDATYDTRGASDAGQKDFLVGSATTIEPYEVISEPENCYTCHNDMYFHGGGRRSFVTCLMCHGVAAAEDRQATTPSTPRLSIGFREMLHKIHKGPELAQTDYPFATEGEFPDFTGGVLNCRKCHGTSDAWQAPSDRTHPQAAVPARVWSFVCGSCHDSDAAHAHIDANVAPNGAEACEVCHGSLRSEDVVKKHVPR